MHVVLVCWILVKSKGKFSFDNKVKSTLTLLFAFYSVVVLNTLFAVSFSFGDISDLVRPLFFIIYFLYGYTVNIQGIDWDKLFKSFILLQLILVICNYLPPFYWVADIWKGRLSESLWNFHFFRASGSMIWPSDFSFIILFMLIFFLYRKSFLYIGLSFILLILTSSRGGMVSLIILIPFILYRFVYIRKYLILYSFITISIFIYLFTSSSIYSDYFTYINNFFELLQTYDTKNVDSSIMHRFLELDYAFRDSIARFPFGVGPSRDYIFGRIDTLETFYGYYLWKYGFLGLFFQLFFYFYVIFEISRNNIKTDSHYSLKSAFIICLVIFITFFGFSSAITERFKLLPLSFMMIGVLMQSNNRKLYNIIYLKK